MLDILLHHRSMGRLGRKVSIWFWNGYDTIVIVHLCIQSYHGPKVASNITRERERRRGFCVTIQCRVCFWYKDIAARLFVYSHLIPLDLIPVFWLLQP